MADPIPAAPDGGAAVHPLRELKSSRPLDTMDVIRLEDGAECVINQKDFDEKLYRKVEDEEVTYASMKKAELVTLAVDRGVLAEAEATKATKAEIIEALEEDDAA